MIVAFIINFILGMITVLPIKEHIESKSDFVFVIRAPSMLDIYYFVYKLVSYVVYVLMTNIIIIYILQKLLKKKNKKLNLIIYWSFSILIFAIPIIIYFRSSIYYDELLMRDMTVF